ncbi:hypothetical protein LMG3410_05178 [Achromobacter aegrifaciens]|jgi:hypothetical protein|uniref:Uncharacterized protein n=1 Tax=Achromobacter aegrifaciens TaxID=1287736 RepID=A0AAD2QD36_ACHAE|nr:hypothetical protein LMG26854_03678 [Achromobacter aegrifaciens]CAB3917260.1 hypothetical protein LMG3410_05178 [Achromobacter aegrifaciens]CUI87433.1 Uncharacterised protein [Achromobacter aegrifaciens]
MFATLKTATRLLSEAVPMNDASQWDAGLNAGYS